MNPVRDDKSLFFVRDNDMNKAKIFIGSGVTNGNQMVSYL